MIRRWMLRKRTWQLALLLLLVCVVSLPLQPLHAQDAPTLISAGQFGCETVTDLAVEECTTLVALFQSTDGPNWSDNEGWLRSSTPCVDWVGVICDDTGHVEEIYLPGNNLRGILPAALGALHHLAFLDLSDNQLSGEIPPTLSQISTLEELYLNDNPALVGAVPEGFVQLQELSLLWLDATQICGVTDSNPDADDETVASLQAAALSALDAWLFGMEDVEGAELPCGPVEMIERILLPLIWN